ncbi:thioester reductase domain-containing protein [Streptomyces sp. NPDC087901]|uniref:thioester reductase domain-containing protein n=1 Tax=Streptomyces sp. NPDC087901 TaxID=3365818 RepID=UPI003815685C
MTATPSVTLLTGATGFLGSALVGRFLAVGDRVRCVVRGATSDDRTGRLRSAVGDLPPGAQERLEVVSGDLGEPLLGLSSGEYEHLGQDVTRVVHCGARVNMALPYASLHPSNVASTESLLALSESRGARFCHIGSLAAVAHTVTGEPFELVDPVTGGYPQSKWAADRLVSTAHQETRLNAAIFRPGRVTTDSRTGRSNPGDLLELVLRRCVHLGVVPDLTGSVRLSPVDWVASLIVTLSGRTDSCGRAYHLVSEEALPWRDAVDVLRAAGYELDEVPYAKWRSLVYRAAREDAATARLAASLPERPLVFDNRPGLRATRARKQLDQEYPLLPPAAALLAEWVRTWPEQDRSDSRSAVRGPQPQGAR